MTERDIPDPDETEDRADYGGFLLLLAGGALALAVALFQCEPASAHETLVTTRPPVIVDIGPAPQHRLAVAAVGHSRPTDEAKLLAEVRNALARTREKTAYVRGHPGAKYREVLRVMTRLEAEGGIPIGTALAPSYVRCHCLALAPDSWKRTDKPDPCRRFYLPEPDPAAVIPCLEELRARRNAK